MEQQMVVFRIWRFCFIRITHSCSHSPLRIPHVMTYPSISVLYRFVCFPFHALSFHPSIHRLCALFWMDVSFDHLYPSYCLFFFSFFFVLRIYCVLLVFNFLFPLLDVSTLYTSPHSDSGVSLLLTPKGLSMLPFHLHLCSLP